ncbi:secretion lowering protein [Scheffersomyces stipitis CBS 6054]|uniref:Secretion lowering protein n=1 Tax=Scheffersomyces stipitis (strain ATCC 58785 / CBS 6054 / NBRC 10063 / NRRL Y-11545) TaxID=322104 RepID=A3GEZ6_PICST|nr:secretion lowering protein [Scheffersomyces stipitis CBS 6054]EAZ63256.2 secretion lowering protein [Scheffersomyces stipitis CBS 6054]
MSELSSEHQELVDQFKAIAGLEDSENDNKVFQLLTINDFNLNNAISFYFDSGFESIEQSRARAANNVHDEQQSELHSRRERRQSQDNVVNLQHQLFVDNFIPRLPKAPRIANGWQLDVGIHTSIIEEREREKLKLQATESSSISSATTEVQSREEISDKEKYNQEKSSSPLGALWIILLLVPKTLLQLLVSAFKHLFGFTSTTSLKGFRDSGRVPKSFNYEHFKPDFNFASWLTSELLKPSSSEFEDDDKQIILDNFNIHTTNFNEVHESAQKKFTWVYVILINDTEEAKSFLFSMLKSPFFNKLFNKENGMFKETLIYINNVDENPESLELAHTYKVKRIPYVMLVGNISASPQVLSSMSILFKSNLAQPFLRTPEECESTSKKVLKNTGKLLEKYDPQLISSRFDQQEIEFARLIKQQQDDAYLQSLELDKQKKLQKEKEAQTKLDEQNTLALQKYFLLFLFSSDYRAEITGGADRSRIAIKLPDGRRIVEAFNKSISVSELYLYIEVKLFIDKLIDEDGELNNEDDLKDSIHTIMEDLTIDSFSREMYFEKYSFKFEVIQPYPKKVVTVGDEAIEKVPELKSGANLLVEYNEEEDSEEE